MAETNGEARRKDQYGLEEEEEEDQRRPTIEIETETSGDGGKETLDGLLRRFVQGIVRPSDSAAPIVWRITASCRDAAPRLKEASSNTFGDLVVWTRRGSPLRAFFVVSVGTIFSLAMAGLMVFMLFFMVATLNAIIVAMFLSLAAAGGVLAIFFTFLTAIYVGALSVAVFVISTITISAAIAVIVATGWIGFFWILWVAAKKSMDLTKQTINTTGSAFSTYRR